MAKNRGRVSIAVLLILTLQIAWVVAPFTPSGASHEAGTPVGVAALAAPGGASVPTQTPTTMPTNTPVPASETPASPTSTPIIPPTPTPLATETATAVPPILTPTNSDMPLAITARTQTLATGATIEITAGCAVALRDNQTTVSGTITLRNNSGADQALAINEATLTIIGDVELQGSALTELVGQTISDGETIMAPYSATFVPQSATTFTSRVRIAVRDAATPEGASSSITASASFAYCAPATVDVSITASCAEPRDDGQVTMTGKITVRNSSESGLPVSILNASNTIIGEFEITGGQVNTLNGQTIAPGASVEGAYSTTFSPTSTAVYTSRAGVEVAYRADAVTASYRASTTFTICGSTPTATATGIATATATATSTPTATATGTATNTPTAPVAVGGSVWLTINTSDARSIPVGTRICVADQCRTLSTALPSGSRVSFNDLSAGTRQISVTGAALYKDASGNVTIVAGESVERTITLERTEPSSRSFLEVLQLLLFAILKFLGR